MSATLTAAKEHPILFKAPMVRAILEGRKTQTRRVMKILGNERGTGDVRWLDDQKHPETYMAGGVWNTIKCPYGVLGDRLWVRETWRWVGGSIKQYYYRADGHDFRRGHWKPSIFMPRKACRTILEATEVRVQRVQSISRMDAINEGIENWDAYDKNLKKVDIFHDLWESINAKRGFGWDVNPWVWAVSFKRINP